MPDRKLLLSLFLFALLAALAFLLWPRPGTAPDGGASVPPTVPTAEQNAAAVAATGGVAAAATDGKGGSDHRQAVPTIPDAERCTVTGTVLAERRFPIAGAHVLAYRGRVSDSSGVFSELMGAMSSGGPRGGPPDLSVLPQGDPLAEAAVGADGTFTLVTGERHLRLIVDHDLYALPSPAIVHVPAATRTASTVLVPTLGGCIRGRVLGNGSKDVREVMLRMEPDPLAVMRNPGAFQSVMLQALRPTVKPDSTGAFVCRAVAPGARVVLFALGESVCGRATQPPLQPGEVREVALPVVAAGAVEANVTGADGKPAVGAKVAAANQDLDMQTVKRTSGSSGEVDAAGHCRLGGLVPGRYRITARAPGTAETGAEVAVGEGATTAVALTLRDGGAVDGVVVDPAGKPLADAHVAHFPVMEVPMMGDLGSQFGLDFMARAAKDGPKTDAEGRFHLGGIDDANKFYVVAMHEKFAGGIARDVQVGARDVRIQMQAAGVVAGRVVQAEDGTPLHAFDLAARVTMFLFMQRPVRQQSVADSADGGFRLEGLAPGNYTFVVHAEGRGDVRQEIKIVGGDSVDVGEVRLARSATVRGTVQAENGTPVAGALVRVRQGGMLDNPMLAAFAGGAPSTTSGADGAFELDGLTPGRVALVASADGFAGARVPRLELTAGQVVADVAIVLGHGGSIRGRVLAPAGERVDEFRVFVKEQTTQATHFTEPDADGGFRVDDLDPGQYEVQAMHPAAMRAIQGSQQQDWQPGKGFKLKEMMSAITDNVVAQRCVVRAGETTEVALDAAELTSGTRLRLDVQVGNRPLAGGLVELAGSEDGVVRNGFVADGRVVFGAVRPGRYRAQVRGGLTLTPIGDAQDVEVPGGKSEHQLTIRLPGGELRGHVVDAGTGKPLRDVLVRLLHANSERDDSIGVALTDADGDFAFTALAEGTYGLVTADAQRSAEGLATRVDGVRVQAGQVTSGVELRATPAGGADIAVTDETGAPLPGAVLLAVDADGRPVSGLGITASGQDGKAHLGGLPRGRVRIIGRVNGYAPGATDVAELDPGQVAQFRLVLAHGTKVVLQTAGRDGQALAGAEVVARCNGGAWFPALLLVERREGGNVELGRLAPGSWEFRVSHPAVGTFTVQRTVGSGAAVTLLATPP